MNKDKLISLLIGLGIGIVAIGIIWFAFFSNDSIAEAKDDHKVYICHESKDGKFETLYVDENALKGHYDKGAWKKDHTNDYFGECIEPTPTPTPTPKPVKDYCKNFEKDQKEVPYGMVSVDGICSCAEGYHQVDEDTEEVLLKKPVKEYDTFTCELDEPEVTPEPEAPVTKTSSSSVTTPTCTDGSTSQLVANLHVWRNGTSADVNFFITEGNHANIYYRENSESNWTHSVIGVTPNSDNYVSYTINELDPNLGYTFGVQQTIGCGTGEIATAVVIDPPANGKLFNFSYWSW